jgi:GMP synthase-like glutamine amidotransferase
MTNPNERRPLSRRSFLQLAGLSTLVAACGTETAALLGPTPEPTATQTPTHTPTATDTATPTATATPSSTPTPTDTATPTHTPTPTPTDTLTPTPTATRGPLRAISLIHGPGRTLVVDHVLKRFEVLSTKVRVDLGETVPDLREFDAVIFAGGEYRPNEFDLPIFRKERTRIMEALEANTPILGICLGHQLLVHWLGGKVKRGRWEIGWLPITVHEPGLSDPLLAGLGPEFHGFLWHGDQVTQLPEEAELLASSEQCRVQAYRLRDRPVWGVQFNPQYTPKIAEALVRNSPWLSKHGWDRQQIIATGHREYDDLAGRIFGNFFNVVLNG